MNGIGIDYQQTLTVLALREGSRDKPRTRLIDDGHRWLIPHAVAPEALWGTKAFLAQPARWLLSAEGLPAGPWLEEGSAGRFWENLYQRTFHYLGRLEPLPREGFQVVVSVPAHPDSEEARVVLGLAEQAGFVHAQVITATDALLCQWLAVSGKAESPPKVVVVIALTDCAVCVAAYRLAGHTHSNELPQFTRGGWLRLDGLGYRIWCDQLVKEIQQHLTEPPAAVEELLLRDGTVEFATRLRSAKRTEVLEWTGPLHERCFSPATFSSGECQSWPSANHLALELPPAVKRVTQTLGAILRPDLFVVGGLGAVWPFVVDIVANLGPMWCGNTPQQDIALGAAWWPLLGRHCLATTPLVALESSGSLGASTLPPAAPAPDPERVLDTEETDSSNIPPWKRHNFFN